MGKPEHVERVDRATRLLIALKQREVYALERIAYSLEGIEALATIQTQQGAQIMADLTRISASVDQIATETGEIKDAAQSATALLDKLADLIRQNATDPAALNALADRIDSTKGELDAAQNSLADAVVRNTPAEPPV